MKNKNVNTNDEVTPFICTDDEIIEGKMRNIVVVISREVEDKIKETKDGEPIEIEGSVSKSEEMKVGAGTSRKWSGTGGKAAIKNPEIKPTTKGRVKISGTKTTPNSHGIFK